MIALYAHQMLNEILAQDLNLAGAQLFIYQAGSDKLRPVFADPGLTHMRNNPVQAGPEGRFPIFHLVSGSYRVEVRSPQDMLLYVEDDLTIHSDVLRKFDRLMSYTPGPGCLPVLPGHLLSLQEEGFSDKVADAAAEGHDMVTAGGVKLYEGISLAAPQSVVKHGVRAAAGDATQELQAALDAAARQTRVGAREVVVRGVGDVWISQ
ncbi:MAG: hypothetical protein HWE30_16550 [Methylocystaceae bacterium]|nr:hypothetical protein [Methylocystaceae bacterium]